MWRNHGANNWCNSDAMLFPASVRRVAIQRFRCYEAAPPAPAHGLQLMPIDGSATACFEREVITDMSNLDSEQRDLQRHELRARLRGFAIKPWERRTSDLRPRRISLNMVSKYIRLGRLWQKSRKHGILSLNRAVDK